MRRALTLVLALACSAQAQQFSSVETLYSGGPKVVRFGFSKPKGTDGAGGAYLGFPSGTVGCWDLGNAKETIRGGYLFAPASNQRFLRSSSSQPCIDGSGTPQYPISVVIWFNAADTTAGKTLLSLSDGSGADPTPATNRLVCYTGASATLYAYVTDSGGSSHSSAASMYTANTWVCGIWVFKSTTSRWVYSSVLTAGASENTTSRVPVTLDYADLGAENGYTASEEWNGRIAYTAVLPVDLSGAGNSAARTAIYAGCDPVRVAGFTYGSLTRSSDGAQGAVWKLDNDAGVDAGPHGFDLTASGSPTAQGNLIVARDLSGGGYHVTATTAAPTYSTSIGNGQGGGVFASASSQFLRLGSTPITAAPFQVYAVAQANDAIAQHTVFWLGDKDVNDDDRWILSFRGDVGSDPTRFAATDSPALPNASINSYSTDTNYLLWGSEEASNARTHERNGGSTATDSTSSTPDNADSLAIGMTRDSTPESGLDGEIHFVLLMNTASTSDQSRIEKWTSTVYALGF